MDHKIAVGPPYKEGPLKRGHILGVQNDQKVTFLEVCIFMQKITFLGVHFVVFWVFLIKVTQKSL